MRASITQIDSRRREPRSAMDRLALAASFVGALAGTGGLLLLVALGGTVELSSAVTYGCWLLSIVAQLARFRGAPLVSALLAAIILYLFEKQPYAMSSLANPSGNYGHFAGVVVILTSVLLLLGASFVSAYRELRSRDT